MSFIERMRQKSESQQRWIAFFIALVVTLAIATMWGMGASEKISQRITEKETSVSESVDGTGEINSENDPIVRVETPAQRQQNSQQNTEDRAQFASPLESIKIQFFEIISLVKNITL